MEVFLGRCYADVSVDTDVLVVHGPPAGYGDRTARGVGVGSEAFLRLVDRVRPSLAVFGHIHEGRGCWTRGDCALANVSAVDLSYRLVREPAVTFEL